MSQYHHNRTIEFGVFSHLFESLNKQKLVTDEELTVSELTVIKWRYQDLSGWLW